jgi:hypothetical protein
LLHLLRLGKGQAGQEKDKGYSRAEAPDQVEAEVAVACYPEEALHHQRGLEAGEVFSALWKKARIVRSLVKSPVKTARR